MGDTITLIGGAGFIGTELSEVLLNNGYEVNIVDKVKSRRFPEISAEADICIKDSLAKITLGSTVIHLAAAHADDIVDVTIYEQVNVNGTANLIEAARQQGVKNIIFTSSVAVYGFCPAQTSEDGECAPFNEYGKTKLRAEKLLKAWENEDSDNNLLIIRPTVVFGAGNRGNVFNLLKQINSPWFTMIGTGANRKSMAYVKNLAQFIQFCISENRYGMTVNYVDKPDLTTADLVRLAQTEFGKKSLLPVSVPKRLALLCALALDVVAKISGRKFPISQIRVQKFCSESSFNSKAWDMGFIAPYDLRAAIQETIHTDFDVAPKNQ